jgi:hypothetical protein
MQSRLIYIGLIVTVITLLLGNLTLSVEAASDPQTKNLQKCGGSKPDECNGKCVNFQNDKENCGSCGNVCRDGEICQKGECVGSNNNNKGISNNINGININKKATCTDGVMNGGETGVDCGGPCKPCPEKVVGNITTAPGRTLKPIPGIGNISAGPAQNAPGTPNPTYKFVFDTFDIGTTRALYEDTDYLGFGVSVKNVIFNGAPQVEKLGDLSNGQYSIILEIGPVPIPNDPNYPVSMAYIIANIGDPIFGDNNAINEKSMGDATKALLNSYVPSSGIPNHPGAMDFAANWLTPAFSSRCDGVVVADKLITNGHEIAQWTASGPYSRILNYEGTDSRDGCSNDKSDYNVLWHVERVS